MMKTVSALSLVLNCCLLGTVIFLGVAVLNLKMSVSQLEENSGAAIVDLSNSLGRLQKTMQMSEGISEGLRVHEAAPGNPLADSTLPGTMESRKRALQEVEQMDVDVKKQQNNSEETRAATDQPSAFCPNGYQKYREVCYKAFETSRNFHESAATCVAHGGTLAMPRDAGINAFLVSLINDAHLFANYWFGLHDQREHGTWEWIDGTPLGTGYSMWAEGQPSDNMTGFQHCGMYWWVKQYRWNDYGCFGQNSFICQTVPSDAPN